MPHSEFMQRLLRLTKVAQATHKSNKEPLEYIQQQNQFSRRGFLNASVKAAAATTLLASCSKSLDSSPINDNSGSALTSNPSIAIIGAGIAGLHAAYLLKKAGFASTIYEAADRTGGRMFSAQNILNNGSSTELGGEFIDSSHLDIISLANEFGLQLLDLYSPEQTKLEQNIYYFNGTSYTDKDFIHGMKHYMHAINRDAGLLSDKITYNSYSPADKKFDNMSIEEYFDSINLKGWLRECLLIAYLGEYGLNTNVCNAINFLYLFGLNADGNPSLYGESDQRYRMAGGNQSITNELTKRLSNQIQYGKRLVKLSGDEWQGYTLHFSQSSGSTKTASANIVIIAVPFTIFRDVEINVDLPVIKRRAIQNLGYGSNSKLLLGFTGRLWADKFQSNGMCYSDNGLQNGWDNTQAQSAKNGGYTIYLGGDDAVSLNNGSTKLQADHYLSKLNQVYPGVSSTYNSKCERMVWPKYKFTKASYSAWTVGQYTTIAGSEGETIGRLYFAGEHTSYNFQGYMNGGAVSGRIAAQRVLNAAGKHLEENSTALVQQHL